VKRYRISLLLLLEAILMAGAAAQPVSFMDIVPDETGFEGAVTVSERRTDGGHGYVTVTIPFRDMRNQTRQGQARLYLTRKVAESKERLPALCHVHYELPQEGAKEYCDRGYVVVTPHHGTYPVEFLLGDGINLSKALLQWVRRLPFIDRTRVQITGGSAGGCMTLAMGAEFFPISALIPEMPAVNWSYGCRYLQANMQCSGALLPPGAERPLPVLGMIAPGLKLATELFGTDLSARAYHTVSAISYVDRITAPTLVLCATGDMLCTIEQFTAKRFFELDREQFPDDYERDFDVLTLDPKARVRFDECIPKGDLSVHVVPLPEEGLHELTREDWQRDPAGTHGLPLPGEIDLPWSKETQWSLVILDEGAPLPETGHTRFLWNVRARSFMAYHGGRGPAPDQLKADKLQRLMERYAGHLTQVAVLADGTPANRLNFETLERLDVVTGLLDYAFLGSDHAKRLEELYRACPVQPFGERPDLQHLEALEAQLRRDLIRGQYTNCP